MIHTYGNFITVIFVTAFLGLIPAKSNADSRRALDFNHWQKISSLSKNAGTTVDVYERDVRFLNHHYSVAALTHTKIKKNGPARKWNTRETEDLLVYGMNLSNVKRKMVGNAHVVEGFWDKGGRYYRLFTQETDTQVDVVLFTTRNLYINTTAFEGEYIQRYITGNLKPTKTASLINHIGSAMFPSAEAQVACPKIATSVCQDFDSATSVNPSSTATLGSIISGGGTNTNIATSVSAFTGAANSVAAAGLADASAGQALSKAFSTQAPKITAALQADAASGQSLASGLKSVSAAMNKAESPLTLSEASATVIVTSIVTAGIVNGGIALIGKGIEAAIAAITGSKDHQTILNELETARNNFTDTSDKAHLLEKQIEANKVLAAELDAPDVNWDFDKLMLKLQQNLTHDQKYSEELQKDMAKESSANCPHCDASSANDIAIRDLKTAIDNLSQIKGKGLIDNRADFCDKVRGDMMAALDAENALQIYRQTFMAATFAPFDQAAQNLNESEFLTRHANDNKITAKACEANKKQEAENKITDLKLQAKKIQKQCEDTLGKLPSYGDWKKHYPEIQSNSSLSSFRGPDASLVGELGQDRLSYHKFVCDNTLDSTSALSLPNEMKDNWLIACYASLGSHFFIHRSRICEHQVETYEKEIPAHWQSMAQCKDDNAIKPQDKGDKAIMHTDTEIVALGLENHLKFLEQIKNEQTCYTSNVDCNGRISRKLAVQNQNKEVAELCPLTNVAPPPAPASVTETPESTK
jgi:hypothetical protein